jgi:hypothetical protein
MRVKSLGTEPGEARPWGAVASHKGQATAMPRYRLAGIVIESDLDLPLPVLTSSAREADVVLKYGLPLTPEEAPLEIQWVWTTPCVGSLSYPHIGVASISGGRTIFLRPCQEDMADSRWHGLLIPCFAALFHQRGSLSLHASAICIGGKAVAFMGDCGAGKSTLVAQLLEADTTFLCDDLLLLGRSDDGAGFVVYPGFSLLKLWQEARQAIRPDLTRLGCLYPDSLKEGFSPAPLESTGGPAPLDSVFLLREGAIIGIQELTKREALAAFLQHTYGADLFPPPHLPMHFRQCADLAAAVRVLELTRPFDFNRTAQVQTALRESLPHLENKALA